MTFGMGSMMGRHHHSTRTMEPTPEQFAEWLQQGVRDGIVGKVGSVAEMVARLAYQAGADGLLRLCVEWVGYNCDGVLADEMQAAMRPKLPSLKEQALDQLEECEGYAKTTAKLHLCTDIIRRALESLPD